MGEGRGGHRGLGLLAGGKDRAKAKMLGAWGSLRWPEVEGEVVRGLRIWIGARGSRVLLVEGVSSDWSSD